MGVKFDYLLKKFRVKDGGSSEVPIDDASNSGGDDIVNLTDTSFAPQPYKAYVRELVSGDTFAFDISNLDTSKKWYFELNLIQPSTAVSFTLPTTGIKWGDGLRFSYSNPAPEMDDPDTIYSIRFQWNGRCLLANLATIEELGEQA